MGLNKEIKKFCHELGFPLVSIIPAKKLGEQDVYLQSWLKKGNCAELDYMKNNAEKRADPEKILPGAKSIICLGMNYYRKLPKKFPVNQGRVARYAWGKDYHKIIEKRLKKIRKFIIEKYEGGLKKNNFKLYVDAGPVLERAYAHNAGLGFVGKNSCLITEKFGSWVFLAEIITTLELEYDKPAQIENKCGNCTKCIDACPTKALCEPFVLDARKCISYQTIENKGGIPDEIRKKMGNRVFGCDICQEVCPFNINASETEIEEFRHDVAGPFVNPVEIAELKEDEFKKKYAGSPLNRAGKKGLTKNVNHML